MYRTTIEPSPHQPDLYRVFVRGCMIGVIGQTAGLYWASTVNGQALLDQTSFDVCDDWLLDQHVWGEQ